MTIQEFLKTSTAKLEQAGITTARLDTLVLLEDVTNQNRAWLLAHPEEKLANKSLRKLKDQLEKRVRHEPLAYIRGKSEFYGREFTVSEHTLQPRPETETMIELLLPLIKNDAQSALDIIDVGTGSGCLAITAELELPNAQVVGVDIDPSCLKIARRNATKLGADVAFHRGDLLEPIYPAAPTEPCVLLCNLPYVPDRYTINQAATHEPAHAIFGGHDGLDLYRKLFAQTKKLPTLPRLVLCESLPPQHTELEAIARQNNYRLRRSQDFIQVFEPA